MPPDAAIAREEIFGPVPAVIKAANFEESLEIANNTEYGLTGSVYTSNRERSVPRTRANSTWGISISIANARGPWWGRTRSADST